MTLMLLVAAMIAACGSPTATNTDGADKAKTEKNDAAPDAAKAAAAKSSADDIVYEEEEEEAGVDDGFTSAARLVPIPKEPVVEANEYAAAVTGLWRQLGVNCDAEGMNCDPSNGADLVFMQSGKVMIGPNLSEYAWNGKTLLLGSDKAPFEILRLSANVLLIKDSKTGVIVRYARKHAGIDD